MNRTWRKHQRECFQLALASQTDVHHSQVPCDSVASVLRTARFFSSNIESEKQSFTFWCRLNSQCVMLPKQQNYRELHIHFGCRDGTLWDRPVQSTTCLFAQFPNGIYNALSPFLQEVSDLIYVVMDYLNVDEYAANKACHTYEDNLQRGLRSSDLMPCFKVVAIAAAGEDANSEYLYADFGRTQDFICDSYGGLDRASRNSRHANQNRRVKIC